MRPSNWKTVLLDWVSTYAGGDLLDCDFLSWSVVKTENVDTSDNKLRMLRLVL